MSDLHRMWKIRELRHLDSDVELSSRQGGGWAVGADFHQKQPGWPGLRTPMGDPGEPMNLLHQLQNVYSRGHNLREPIARSSRATRTEETRVHFQDSGAGLGVREDNSCRDSLPKLDPVEDRRECRTGALFRLRSV